jgi:hypothetical protein
LLFNFKYAEPSTLNLSKWLVQTIFYSSFSLMHKTWINIFTWWIGNSVLLWLLCYLKVSTVVQDYSAS